MSSVLLASFLLAMCTVDTCSASGQEVPLSPVIEGEGEVVVVQATAGVECPPCPPCPADLGPTPEQVRALQQAADAIRAAESAAP